MENAVKAVLASRGPVPRAHDLTTPPAELLARGVLTAAQQHAADALRACAEQLGHEAHVRADYGEEASFQTPWELFDEADARRALAIAEHAWSLARSIPGR